MATPGDLSSSVKKQYGHTGERPAKGHRDNEGMGAPHLRGRRTRTVQPREQKAQGEMTDIHKYLKRGHKVCGVGLFPITPSD